MSKFGKVRLRDFYLDPSYININHGSFGACPKVVLDYKHKVQQEMQFNGQIWFRGQSEKRINQMRSQVAKIVNCKTQNLYFVQNATDAINCLMKSLSWSEGDIILITNTTYPCIRKTLLFLKERYKVAFLQVVYTAQDMKSQQKILEKVQNTVNLYGKKIKLAVLDHTISTPGIITPIELISEFFNQWDIPLFVDAAHAFGQTKVDLGAFGVSAYFANFHKWSFAPKSAAFLYISDKYLPKITTAITGNYYGEGPARQFYWTGTRDYGAYLSLEEAFKYYESLNGMQVYEYNHGLVIKAAQQMARIWKTKTLTNDDRAIGFMHNVLAPTDNLQLCVQICHQMMVQDNCYPVFFKFDGHVYCRISAQVYNELSDYQFAANRFLDRLKLKEKELEQKKNQQASNKRSN